MKAGLLAEFAGPEPLLAAVIALRAAGKPVVDTYTPYPIAALEAALELKPSRIARVSLVAGLTGATLAYLVQWGLNAFDYPLIVGGRPPNAVPAFILIMFEMTILFAGFSAFFAFLIANRLPKLWDPVFEVEGFERASIDRFWLRIEPSPEGDDDSRLRDELRRLGALQVVAVPEALR